MYFFAGQECKFHGGGRGVDVWWHGSMAVFFGDAWSIWPDFVQSAVFFQDKSVCLLGAVCAT